MYRTMVQHVLDFGSSLAVRRMVRTTVDCSCVSIGTAADCSCVSIGLNTNCFLELKSNSFIPYETRTSKIFKRDI